MTPGNCNSERIAKYAASWPHFDSLGEYALKLLWENGLDPTVAAIVGDARRLREG